MAHSRLKWDKAREYVQRGMSLREASKKTGISPTQLSKRSREERWLVSGEIKQQLLDSEVEVYKDLATINAQKRTIFNGDATAALVHEELLREALKYNKIIVNMTGKGLKLLNAKMDQNTTIPELKSAMDTIGKAKDNLIGKEPATVINNQNNQQTNVVMDKEQIDAALRNFKRRTG